MIRNTPFIFQKLTPLPVLCFNPDCLPTLMTLPSSPVGVSHFYFVIQQWVTAGAQTVQYRAEKRKISLLHSYMAFICTSESADLWFHGVACPDKHAGWQMAAEQDIFPPWAAEICSTWNHHRSLEDFSTPLIFNLPLQRLCWSSCPWLFFFYLYLFIVVVFPCFGNHITTLTWIQTALFWVLRFNTRFLRKDCFDLEKFHYIGWSCMYFGLFMTTCIII